MTRTGVVLRTILGALVCGGCKSPPPQGGEPSASATASSPVVPQPSAPTIAIPAPSASVVAKLNPDGLPPYKGDTGSVEGVVTVKGPPAPDAPHEDFTPCPDAAKTYGKLFREGGVSPDGGRALADAVVAVTGYSGFYLPDARESVTVTARGCALSTRTITMTYGQRLDFANESAALMLAPALADVPAGALMVASPKGGPVKLYPPRPGRYWLVQRMDWRFLTADLFAFLHPLHTATDVEGHYRIDGVPVGKLTVNTRHPAFGGETSREIEVKKGMVHRVDLTLTFKPDTATSRSDAGARVILR